MTKVQEIERTVLTLPEADYTRFRQWFLEEDWKKWDEQLDADVKAGRTQFDIQLRPTDVESIRNAIQAWGKPPEGSAGFDTTMLRH